MKLISTLFKSLFVATIIFLFGFKSEAQITLTDNQSAQDLAQMLAGAGVTVMNATMNGSCPNTATGKFSYNSNPSTINIDSGIVLTCGRVVTINPSIPDQTGINADYDDFASNEFDPSFNSAPGDPDLDILNGSPNSTNDACVLEFDFVPAGDTVKFDYVFASEEYHYIPTNGGADWNFNCSINDIFGFFISGPGLPSGLNNIALIPNTNIQVGVSSINDGVTDGSNGCDEATQGLGPFTQYYVSNSGNPDFVYSGFTVPLQAVASVIPCDTFHLKLAIADAGDDIYDSGVFLKAGSLNSIGIAVTGETGGGQPEEQSHAVRGCKPGKFDFSLPNPQVADLTIHYVISGTADANDYEPIPDSIIIPAGETSAQLIINAVHNNMTNQNPETVILSVYSPYLCGNGEPNIIASDTMYIYDSLFATPATPPPGICPGDSVLLSEEIANGLNIHWEPAVLTNDPNNISTWVHPTAPTMFTASVTQPGAPSTCPPVKRNFFVHVDPIPKIVLPDDHITICLSDSVDLPVDVLPDTFEYTFKWLPGDHLRSDTIGYNHFYAPEGNYDYLIKAYSPLGCLGTKDLTIEVLPPFNFTDLSPDTTINYGDQIQLRAKGALLYEWSPPRWMLYPNEATPFVKPEETIVYNVVGVNEFGCRDTADVKVTVNYQPQNMLPSAFSPNGDGLNDRFKIEHLGDEKILQFAVFNRWGQQVYNDPGTNIGWDGNIDGKPGQVDVYNYIIQLSSPQGYVRTFKGNVTLVR